MLAVTIFLGKATAQTFDDGTVTQYLRVNTADSKFSLFAENFRKGIETVKKGEWTSMDQIATATGVDLRKYPKFSQLSYEVGENTLSDGFIKKLQDAVSNTDIAYNTIGDFRNALVAIATKTGLTVKDAEMLALVDIATQEMAVSLISDGPVAALGSVQPADDAAFSLFEMANISGGNDEVMVNDLKLPHWVRCALGTIGSAIAGGLAGAGTGMTFGSAVPGIGTALGGVVGGIGGVISGTFIGIATFCD